MLDWNSIVPGCVTDGVASLNCIPAVFQNLIQALLLFMGIAAIFLMIHAGSKFVLSSGDPKRVEEARNTLIYAVLGLIIIAAAFLIVNLVGRATGVDCIKLNVFGSTLGFECL